MSDRLRDEQLFHDKTFSGQDNARQRAEKYYSIKSFPTEYYKSLIRNLCEGANLLEYGCGTGNFALYWAEKGARVTGIDISAEGINKAIEKAAHSGLPLFFYKMNAEAMQFENDSFDVVIGTSIIHHLNLQNAYEELCRVLRKDGHAIFIEPLGHNPVINFYRKLTPTLRTKDEHPLLMRDIKQANKYFKNVKSKHFHIFTLLAVPFRKFFFFNIVLKILYAIDNSLMAIFPFLKRYSWIVVIDLHAPQNKL